LWSGLEKRPSTALRLSWRQLISLFLQLIALVAIVVGLAQPVVFSSGSGVARLAILIDSSASMRASDAGSENTRYDQAVQRAYQLLDENPAAEVMVISLKENSEILAMPTRNHASVRRALSDSTASYQGEGNLNQLFSLLQSQDTREFERVALITDEQPEVDVSSFGWDLMLVGDRSQFNSAITQFSVREQPNGSGTDLYLILSNSGPEDVTRTLQIYSDQILVRSEAIAIPANSTTELTYHEPNSGTTRFRAELGLDSTDDQWLADNIRYATVPTPSPWRILWVGPENIYLMPFLELSDDIDFSVEPEWTEDIHPDSYDVVILNEVDVYTPISGRYVLINSSLNPWVIQGATVETGEAAIVVNEDHPFIANMDPTAWRFLDVAIADTDPDGDEILTLAGHPALYLYEDVGIHLAYLGVSLNSSNLVLTVDFPILVYRLISWLAPRSDQSMMLTAGDEIPVFEDVEQTTVIDSAGRTCEFAESGSGCGKVDQPGFYQVFYDGNASIYAINVNSAESFSDGNGSGIEFSGTGFTPINVDTQAATLANVLLSREIWPYLVALGLLFLLIEFIVFDQSVYSIRRMLRRTSL